VLLFVKVIRGTFGLRYWESYGVFALALLPFTTDLPQAMSTQEILTEGIAYALFYVFMIMLLKAVWMGSYAWLAGALLMTAALSMVRPQLQILFAVCGMVFFYLFLRNRKNKGRAHVTVRIFGGAAGCVLIMLLGVMLVSRMAAGYRNVIDSQGDYYVFALKLMDPDDYEEYLKDQEALAGTEEDIPWNVGEIDWKTVSEEKLILRPLATSQYVSLIFSRGIYEADRQDAELFEDETVRELFLKLYEAVDAEEQRYAYAQPGLWMWKDIVGGIGMAGKTCLAVPSEYYAAYHQEIMRADDFNEIRNRHLTTIGMTLLKAHFGRFLYHTLMLLPSAFICTVFFQIAPIYGLCHLITLLLYVTAIGLMIWGYRDRTVDNQYADLMAVVLVTNVVMVVIISLVFFGQQRYLVYSFGIFYVAYGLLAEQLWKRRLRDRICSRYRNR
jgi:hypothetical protein